MRSRPEAHDADHARAVQRAHHARAIHAAHYADHARDFRRFAHSSHHESYTSPPLLALDEELAVLSQKQASTLESAFGGLCRAHTTGFVVC